MASSRPIYLDSSAVFSLYAVDANTPAAIRLIDSAMEPMLVTSFCEFETLNAFNLGQFRGSMTEVEVERLRNNFQSDIKAGIFIPLELPQSSFTRAISLSSRITASVGVRAADLLHIAAALELGATTLYTFDQRQSKAALAVGLKVN